MGFFSNILSSAVKTVISPVAIVADVVKVAVGVEPDTTKNLLSSAGDDFDDAIDNIDNIFE